jgi:hypothetical protein
LTAGILVTGMATEGATVSVPGKVGSLGFESLAVVTATVELAAQDKPARDQSLVHHAAVG